MDCAVGSGKWIHHVTDGVLVGDMYQADLSQILLFWFTWVLISESWVLPPPPFQPTQRQGHMIKILGCTGERWFSNSSKMFQTKSQDVLCDHLNVTTPSGNSDWWRHQTSFLNPTTTAVSSFKLETRSTGIRNLWPEVWGCVLWFLCLVQNPCIPWYPILPV